MRIGMSGKMASGKNVVANYLESKHGFVRLSFAARVKELCREMFGVDPVKKGPRDRAVLQQFAQHMRAIDPQVWVRYVAAQIECYPSHVSIVVDDVRYPNEYETLRAKGFQLWRMYLTRPDQEAYVRRSYPNLPLELLDDSSETALDGWRFDALIDNRQGVPLDYLYKAVDELVGAAHE